jgi:hypothetical protein
VTLRRKEDAGILMRKHKVALSVELALEEAVDLLKGRPHGDDGVIFQNS